jgi:hypothetical protein
MITGMLNGIVVVPFLLLLILFNWVGSRLASGHS